MYQVEPLNDIIARFRKAGRPIREAVAEHKRQQIERLRDEESAILEAAKDPGAHPHTIAVAESIRDHRAAGNYTTMGR